jgi:hypothetical protein
MKWPWKKQILPEDELRLAEEQRDKEQARLDHLNELLEVKIETAHFKIEQTLVQVKLKNPEQEFKRRLEVEKYGKEESHKEETKQDFNKKRQR